MYNLSMSQLEEVLKQASMRNYKFLIITRLFFVASLLFEILVFILMQKVNKDPIIWMGFAISHMVLFLALGLVFKETMNAAEFESNAKLKRQLKFNYILVIFMLPSPLISLGTLYFS
jgi:uncharacterized membrane protein